LPKSCADRSSLASKHLRFSPNPDALVKVAYCLNERLSLKRLFKKAPRFAEPRTSWLKGSALVMSVWPLNSRGLRQSRLAFLLKLPVRNSLVLSNPETVALPRKPPRKHWSQELLVANP
jgi:hypothetical protein